eukprot:CAMPEP_0113845360 /NCGR_PEP_ID=MMETSP0372-20130328/715_1 /TAXON_ID=340204 /ORGANISM="Lankesteria abbotti" /LENGTH=338 /DNA_ID=CAMNT_0000814397 /DNA_START=86 /DNA_END=1099 /DNA_ORIENTATION=- /assembly_acc=CAM_ASM_000359
MVLDHVLEVALASFLPAREILRIRRLCKRINYSVNVKDGIFQTTANGRWEKRGFPQQLIRPASEYISNPLIMHKFRSIFFGFIEDDGSYGGRGVQPSSSGDQPHDYVLREAVAEWLMDVLVKMHKSCDAHKSTEVNDYGLMLNLGEDFVQLIKCKNFSVLHPFLILNATCHEHDDAKVREVDIRHRMKMCDIDEVELNFLVECKGNVDGCEEIENDMMWPETSAESNGTAQLVDLLFGGCVRIPLWAAQSVARWRGKSAAECGCDWYFPKWLLNNLARMSASQSAMKRRKQPQSPESPEDRLWFDRRFASFVTMRTNHGPNVYILAVEVGDYTAGFFW